MVIYCRLGMGAGDYLLLELSSYTAGVPEERYVSIPYVDCV